MLALNEEQRWKVLVNFYKINIEKGKWFTENHFILMGMSESTVYSNLKKLTNDRNVSVYKIVKRNSESEGHNRFFTPRNVSQFKKRVHGNTGLSQRKIDNTFGISQESLMCLKSRNSLF